MTDDNHEHAPLIATDVLDELREVLGDELDEIVEHFVAQLDEQVNAVGDALDAGERVMTVEAAHSLKGGAGNFGANRLSMIAAMIERAGRDGDLAKAAGLLAALRDSKRLSVEHLTALGYCKPR